MGLALFNAAPLYMTQSTKNLSICSNIWMYDTDFDQIVVQICQLFWWTVTGEKEKKWKERKVSACYFVYVATVCQVDTFTCFSPLSLCQHEPRKSNNFSFLLLQSCTHSNSFWFNPYFDWAVFIIPQRKRKSMHKTRPKIECIFVLLHIFVRLYYG